MSAAIAATRVDGRPWHTQPPEHTWKVIGAIAGLFVGQPELGMTAGSMFDDQGGAFGPAPMATLSLGGTTYETAALAPTFQPRWHEDLIVDVSRSAATDPVVITVRDGIDGSTISQRTLTVADLVSRGGHMLTMDNGVISLELRVEAATPQSLEQVVQVTSSSGIRVAFDGGDLVEIEARGEVCLRPGRCVGPDGDAAYETAMHFGDIARPRWRGFRHNYAGFEWTRHGSLVASFDDRPIPLGASALIRIPRRGELMLFVNDTDSDNNSGELEVAIRVNSAASTPR